MKLGEIKYFTHSSKTECVFVDKKELPLISIDIWCKAGSSFENGRKNGTAHFLEHMIFKGNKRIKPGEFDKKIESLGGMSNASTGYDDVHYYVLIPQDNFRESLALLTNIVLTPQIDKKEFHKEKNVVIDEIKQQNDQPDEKLFNYFLRRVWESDCYGKSILGTENSIKLLGVNDLENFHKENYTNNNICIAIAGNLSKSIYKIIEEYEFKFLNELIEEKTICEKNIKANQFKAKSRTGREEVKFDNIEFPRILMAWNIPTLNHQKIIIGFEILAAILSVGRNSRLVKILKEEKDLIESIYVDVNAGELGSLFLIEACTYKENLITVEENINSIINEILDYKDLTIDEIRKGINIVKSNYLFNLETSSQLSSFFGNELLWGRKDSVKNIEIFLNYWNSLVNFKEITNYLTKDKFTLIVYPNK